jgi:hypothetical protein
MRIDGVLDGALSRTSPATGRLRKVTTRYRALVSEGTLAHARPTSIRRDVLYVTVTDPVWKAELGYFVPTFLEAFNEVLAPDERLREIRLRVGPLPAQPPARRTPAGQARPAAPTGSLPAHVRARIEKVEDPELRDLMARVASRAGPDDDCKR